MADRNTNPKTWLAAFTSKVKSVIIGETKATRHQETEFRDLFVEIPVDHVRPVTNEERARRAFIDALSQLAKTKDADDVQQFKDGLKRVFSSLSKECRSDEQISDLHSIINNLEWLMERRIEQVVALRYYITEFCSRGLAARILHESAATVNGGHRKPAMTDAPQCDGDEHTYQLGELRCDCGRVAVRRAAGSATDIA